MPSQTPEEVLVAERLKVLAIINVHKKYWIRRTWSKTLDRFVTVSVALNPFLCSDDNELRRRRIILMNVQDNLDILKELDKLLTMPRMRDEAAMAIRARIDEDRRQLMLSKKRILKALSEIFVYCRARQDE